MNTLEAKRLEIEKIDSLIIDLFIKRMAVVKEIALYKKENNLQIENIEREKFLLEKNLLLLNNEELEEYYVQLMKEFIRISKEYQNYIIEKESK